MAFFKPSTASESSKMMGRLHALIWTLIYAGLLTAVLGLSVARSDEGLGWSLIIFGILTAGAGAVLIYLRSRINTNGNT